MTICCWLKLFIQQERKSVSNNLIQANQYGMLYKSINAYHYPFTFSTAVYSGKPKARPTSYYTPGTSQTVKYLIQNLESHTNLVGRNISYDRLYNSIPISHILQYQWLLDRGITSVGNLQSNRKGSPAEIKEIKDRETSLYEVYWEKDNGILNLHSYVAKTKSSGKQNIISRNSMTSDYSISASPETAYFVSHL